jgi:hypothetical protein
MPVPYSQRGRADVASPTSMPNDVFADSVRERLYADRIAPPPGVLTERWDCPGCGLQGVMDRKGTHIGSCNHSSGYRQLRHDSVVYVYVYVYGSSMQRKDRKWKLEPLRMKSGGQAQLANQELKPKRN